MSLRLHQIQVVLVAVQQGSSVEQPHVPLWGSDWLFEYFFHGQRLEQHEGQELTASLVLADACEP
jgi:hypothetical protein